MQTCISAFCSRNLWYCRGIWNLDFYLMEYATIVMDMIVLKALVTWCWHFCRVARYTTNRYGVTNKDTNAAWQLLFSTIYNCLDTHSNHNHGVPVQRPSLKITPFVSFNLSSLLWCCLYWNTVKEKAHLPFTKDKVLTSLEEFVQFNVFWIFLAYVLWKTNLPCKVSWQDN